ncbi:hypothetical protein HHI36_000239 [Cryptolaemus montrouzieri]|uniref:CHK kinase-like domain-containing protein n=1 Tax=Cryptolaemus montrouzieri TaxID=559131 RepID=A0ABD2P423_9CUCU
MNPTPVICNKNCDKTVLQELLSKFWKKKVDVSNPVTELATTKGNNFVSDAWRVKFSYKEVDKNELLKSTVIVKSKPDNEAQNTLMHTDIAFKNEILAYEEVIPTLNKYLGAPLRVPRYVHGDTTSIVLEDMNNRSFQTINKKLATEWNQVWSPIQEMAKLHAASIIMQKLNKKEFDALIKKITVVPFDETTPLGEKQATALDTISRILEERKTPESIKCKEVVESLKKGAWQAQKDIIDKEVPIRVINHGSIWINNLLYRNDMITLLDWQHIVYSSPATDLSFFLYVNLDTDFLSNKRKKLLDFYILNLHQNIYDVCINEFGVGELEKFLSSFTYDWIDSELRRCSLYGYMMAQWITPVFYWSEAVFQQLESIGGIENLSVTDRLKHMTFDQKDRVIKLTKHYLNDTSN